MRRAWIMEASRKACAAPDGAAGPFFGTDGICATGPAGGFDFGQDNAQAAVVAATRGDLRSRLHLRIDQPHLAALLERDDLLEAFGEVELEIVPLGPAEMRRAQ